MRHKFIGCLLAALCLAGPLDAQLPRQRYLETFSQIRSHLRTGRFARTVTVSPISGDFAEPDAACTYVAGQTRSATATWIVLIYPGNYTTDCAGSPVALPTFTKLFSFEAAAGHNGTVTSVGVTMPAEFTVTGSPVTTSGTIAVTEAPQAQNSAYAGPASGGSGAPGFRPLVIEDLPFAGTPSGANFARGDGTWGAPAVGPLTQVRVVDPGGAGDFTTLEDAVAFVATQTRSDTQRWVIRLAPGPNYTLAAPLTVPTFTSIVGDIPHSIYPFYGQTRIISPSISSGTFLTMTDGSALVSVNVRFSGTLSGAARIIEITTGLSALVNVTIENNASAASQPLSMVETTAAGAGFVMYYGYLTSIANATNLTYVKHAGGTSHIVDTLMRSSTGALAIIHNTGTGTISVLRSALGAFYSTNSDPNTCSLKNDSTGKIEPIMTSYWAPTCGTIDDWHAITRVRTFVDTPPATCTPIPSEITLDVGSTKRLCVCVAANDWDCAALTP